MFQKQGMFITVATGAVVRKHCGVHNDQPYAYVTLVRVEQHKEEEYKHYLEVRMSGNDAKYVDRINKGDSLIIQGQMVTTYQDVGRPDGRKEAKSILRCDAIQSHRLPSKETRQRIEGGNQQQAPQAQQQAPQQAPQQPVPADAQYSAPQQNAPQYNEPPQDFDDDIPF